MYESKRGGLSQVAVGATSGQFLVAAPKRCSLVICSSANALVTITDHPGAVLGQGLNINQGTAPVILRRSDVGDWITKQLFAIGAAATNLGVIEGYDDDLI